MAAMAKDEHRAVPPVGTMVLVNPAADVNRGEAEMATFMEEVYGIPFARIRRWTAAGDEETLVARLTPLIEAGVGTLVLIPALPNTLQALSALSRVADQLRRAEATVPAG
jgi:acetyl esterase/lipase